MKVMIVEDDLISRKWLQRFLTKWGYEVSCYPDGADAWRALTSDGAPELLLVDWMMPNVDGVELCSRIRSNADTKHSYIIMLTAKSNKTDLIAGLEAGADDYLVKPVDPEELKTRIHVGERTLEIRHDLRDRVSELESLLRRHNILGEVYRKNIRPTIAGVTPESSLTAKNSDQPRQTIPNLDGILAHCFDQMGWGEATLSHSDSLPTDTYRLSSALIMKDSAEWIDLAIDVTPESALALFGAMMDRRPVDERELADGLDEAVDIIQGAIRKSISVNGGVTTFTPFLPTLTPSTPNDPSEKTATVVKFVLGGSEVHVVLQSHPLEFAEKLVKDLRASDVFGETKTIDLPNGELILTEGSVPTAAALRKLGAVQGAVLPNDTVRVFTPARAGAHSESVSVFSAEALLKSTKGDIELCLDMVNCFLADNSNAFDSIHDAIRSENWEVATTLAHSLKGSISYFSRGVARAVAEVEEAARCADMVRAEKASHIVKEQIAQLIRELTVFVEESLGKAV
jgi:CheY-like chemotaxis protein